MELIYIYIENRNSTKPLFNACIKGYENIVRYLIKPEIGINKKRLSN